MRWQRPLGDAKRPSSGRTTSPSILYSAVLPLGLRDLCLCVRLDSLRATPLQRYYLPIYERTSIIGAFSTDAPKQLPDALRRRGAELSPRPAMNDDVVLGKTREAGRQPIPLALSAERAPAWLQLALSRPAAQLCGCPVA